MIDDAAEEDFLPTKRGRRIGTKLALIVAICISAGYAILVTVQVQSFAQHTHNLLIKRDIYDTKLIATQISTGLWWLNKELVERAYRAFTLDPESPLANIMTLDKNGEIVTTYQSGQHRPADLTDAVARARDHLSKGEIYSFETKDHFINVVPVTYGALKTRVGTLVVAWSLTSLHESVFEEFERQAFLSFIAVAAFISLLVFLLHRAVSWPLKSVTKATLKLAGGDMKTLVPFTDREDEIGDLSRSLRVFKQNLQTIEQLHAEQQDHTEQLAHALEREKEYNVLQREFVAMASHEFRTPLTIIDSSAQRVERRLDRLAPEQIKEKAKQIRLAVKRMTNLIESVLSTASFDSGTLQAEFNPCDLKAIVASVCAQQQEISPTHDIAVNLEAVPSAIVGDARLLEQVFTNLLSNAVKYAPNAPRIDVVASLRDQRLCIAVTDRGLGIPLPEQKRIFDRYFRASTSTGIAGTGIGLSLVSQAVALHGGTMELESITGMGSTFTVVLPIEKSSAALQEQAEPSPACRFDETQKLQAI